MGKVLQTPTPDLYACQLSTLALWLVEKAPALRVESYGWRCCAPSRPDRSVSSHGWAMQLWPAELGDVNWNGDVWRAASADTAEQHHLLNSKKNCATRWRTCLVHGEMSTSAVMTERYCLWGRLIVQELCESRGGRPGMSVLTSLLVSVDVKNYWTVLRHWSQLVPNMSADIWEH